MNRDKHLGDVNVNDVLAFLVEVGTLILLGWWAWRFARSAAVPVRVLAVVLVVGAAGAAWGLFAAPRATFEVPVAAAIVKVLVLGGGVLAGSTVLPTVAVAVIWAVLVAVNTLLIYVGPFAH